MIEDAVREDGERIDFLRGQEDYKYWWGAEDRETFPRVLKPGAGCPLPKGESFPPGGQLLPSGGEI